MARRSETFTVDGVLRERESEKGFEATLSLQDNASPPENASRAENASHNSIHCQGVATGSSCELSDEDELCSPSKSMTTHSRPFDAADLSQKVGFADRHSIWPNTDKF